MGDRESLAVTFMRLPWTERAALADRLGVGGNDLDRFGGAQQGIEILRRIRLAGLVDVLASELRGQ